MHVIITKVLYTKKSYFLQIYISYKFIASSTVNKVREMLGFHDEDYARSLQITMGYNTIAICIVNKVLEKNFRFEEFKLGIKTAFIFHYVEKKTVYIISCALN